MPGGRRLPLLAGGALFLVVRVPPDRITPENCDRIEVGMTEGEVEAILGGTADAQLPVELWQPPWKGEKVWIGVRWAVFIQFDARGRVQANGGIEDAEPIREFFRLPAPTFWQKVRSSLGW